MTYPRGNLEGFYHRERTPVRIMGRFTVDAAPAVNCVDLHGRGYTAAVTAVGRYTITFTDAVYSLITANATAMVVSAGSTDTEAQLGAFTPGGTGAATLVIRNMTAGAETDLLVDDYMCFEVVYYSEAMDA